jgi:hypothetical protein
MPVDEVVIRDMPQLYYTALRALEYYESSSEWSPASSAGVSRHTSRKAFSREKRLDGGLSTWLHGVLSHLLVSAARRHT